MGFLEYVIAHQELLGFIAAGLGAISFLPQEILASINTSTLKLEKESFVEPDLQEY